MSKRRRKHHYLPRYYLEGFINESGGFFIYDKELNTIFESSPSSFFLEKDLNTIKLPKGEFSDFLEDIYTGVENKVWESFDLIRESHHNHKIPIKAKMDLFFFLSFLHWRLPKNFNHAESLADEFFRKGGSFEYLKLNKGLNEIARSDILDKIRNSDFFKKSAKAIIPLAPFCNSNDWLEPLVKWRFAHSGDGRNWYMVGDSPIITDGKFDSDPIKFLDEFIFPISGKILLLNNDIKAKDLSPDFIFMYNVVVLHKSKRFIACPNKEFLEVTVNYYKKYKEHNMEHLIMSQFFDLVRKSADS